MKEDKAKQEFNLQNHSKNNLTVVDPLRES